MRATVFVLALALPSLPAYAQLAPERSLDGPRVVWSGRLEPAEPPARLERDAQTSWLRDAAGREVPLEGRAVHAAVCRDARDAVLHVTARNEERAWLLTLDADGPRERFELPGEPVSAPVPWVRGGRCEVALVLDDGSLLRVADAAVVERTEAVLPPLRDLTELGRGVVAVAVDDGALVASYGGTTVVWTPGRAPERLELALAGPALAGTDAVWALDRAGRLVSVTLDGVEVLAPGLGPSTSGLTATRLGRVPIVAWATTDGVILAYDGSAQRELARWDAPTRSPLLVVDPEGEGRLALLALLEDGTAAVVRETESERVPLSARSGGLPALIASAHEAPLELALAQGHGARRVPFAQLGPVSPFADGVTPVVGEVVANGVSRPSRVEVERWQASAQGPSPAEPHATSRGPAIGGCQAAPGGTKLPVVFLGLLALFVPFRNSRPSYAGTRDTACARRTSGTGSAG